MGLKARPEVLMEKRRPSLRLIRVLGVQNRFEPDSRASTTRSVFVLTW
jgi:hypothetical protein